MYQLQHTLAYTSKCVGGVVCGVMCLPCSLATGLLDKFGTDEQRHSMIPSLCTMEVCLFVC